MAASCTSRPPDRPPQPSSAVGETVRDGCDADQVRVHTALVDVCVDLYEAPGFGSVPTRATFEQAQSLCAAAGRRLCTEQEWETACRGPSGHLYPYGDDFDPEACVVGQTIPSAVGARNACRSGFGAYDMSGNAGEWVSGPLIKGGDFGTDDFGARCGARARAASAEDSLTGVRCCSAPS